MPASNRPSRRQPANQNLTVPSLADIILSGLSTIIGFVLSVTDLRIAIVAARRIFRLITKRTASGTAVRGPEALEARPALLGTRPPSAGSAPFQPSGGGLSSTSETSDAQAERAPAPNANPEAFCICPEA